jgi:hypothetical protein
MLLRSFALLAVAAFPIAARAADDNPYKNAKVGDFVKYNIKSDGGIVKSERTTLVTVTAKTDKEVTIKSVVTIQGKDTPATETKIDLTKPFDPLAAGAQKGATVKKLKDGTEKIKVGDKEYDCNWTSYEIAAPAGSPAGLGGETKVWLCKDVVGGVVKQTTSIKFGTNVVNMDMVIAETGSKK